MPLNVVLYNPHHAGWFDRLTEIDLETKHMDLVLVAGIRKKCGRNLVEKAQWQITGFWSSRTKRTL